MPILSNPRSTAEKMGFSALFCIFCPLLLFCVAAVGVAFVRQPISGWRQVPGIFIAVLGGFLYYSMQIIPWGAFVGVPLGYLIGSDKFKRAGVLGASAIGGLLGLLGACITSRYWGLALSSWEAWGCTAIGVVCGACLTYLL
jgi:hypothetical protein